jgi:hypothetical protein
MSFFFCFVFFLFFLFVCFLLTAASARVCVLVLCSCVIVCVYVCASLAMDLLYLFLHLVHHDQVTHTINTGNIDTGLAESAHIFEGEVRIGGQEHFYFETNGAMVIPEENNEYTVWASTQNPTITQEYVASIVWLPLVVCVVDCGEFRFVFFLFFVSFSLSFF